ncbi:esterase [Frondihabitans sucicola]|uniref:Esterase n=1 Tax=Frondihabitans sucicola TaxID=1268041 RepID=A0ABM8GKD9_9MICO|nr:serine hydrolase domain-containing protein [Frondihabitans sucicola]BDZ48859.1 esterase [Frondihabitans sucicola]
MRHTDVVLSGHAQHGYGAVADVFRENFSVRGDTGAACSIYVDGQHVVELWGGDTGRGTWTSETRSVLFSVSKGITTICLLMAVEEGALALDSLVTDYWPEYGSGGKAATTVRDVLAHRAGLIAPAERVTLSGLQAWTPVVDLLARQVPMWEPGTAFAYHAITFGYLAGEILRRATGKRPAQWLQDRIASPLHLRAGFGADPTDADFAFQGEQLATAADTTGPGPSEADVLLLDRVLGMNGAYDGLRLFDSANRPDFLAAEIPAADFVSSAGALARIYAATVGEVDGVRLLQPETLRDAIRPVSFGAPLVGPDEGLRWGTGFMIDNRARRMAGEGSFGHDGAGGHLGFARLEGRVSFAYQTIRPGGVPDERAELLSAALRACL